MHIDMRAIRSVAFLVIGGLFATGCVSGDQDALDSFDDISIDDGPGIPGGGEDVNPFLEVSAEEPVEQLSAPNASVELVTASSSAVKFFGGTMAPATVHVHAIEVPLATGSRLTAQYQWDFGDRSGGVEAKYNRIPGWNAAHIYDRDGTYYARLTVTDEARQVKTYQLTVIVEKNTRRTLYVSKASVATDDASNPGTSASRPLRSIQRAIALLQDNTQILFRRGDSFDSLTTAWINYNNVLVGAYGSGARPVMTQPVAAARPLFRTNDNVRDVIVQDLHLDSPAPASDDKNVPTGITTGGTNITVRNCVFEDVSSAVQTDPQPRGIMLVENSVPAVHNLRSYFTFASGEDYVLIKNTVPNSTRESIVRAGGGRRILALYNDFANVDRRPPPAGSCTSACDPVDTAKDSFRLWNGAYAYASGNKFTGGVQLGYPWVVFERNQFKTNLLINAKKPLTAGAPAIEGGQHVMIRNNLQLAGNRFVTIQPPPQLWDMDLHILYNTSIQFDSRGQFLHDQLDTWIEGVHEVFPKNIAAGSIKLVGNIYQNRSLDPTTGGTNVSSQYPQLSHTRWSDHNVWQALPAADAGRHHNVAGWLSIAGWDALPPTRVDRYELSSLSSSNAYTPASTTQAATLGGKATGVFNDLNGKPRPTDPDITWTVGAVQR